MATTTVPETKLTDHTLACGALGRAEEYIRQALTLIRGIREEPVGMDSPGVAALDRHLTAALKGVPVAVDEVGR